MPLDPENVCAVLVTRGDVDMQPIIETLPYGEILVYDNSQRPVDFKVFGRYMGILETAKPVIYFQDDDCIVRNHDALLAAYEPGMIVANMRDDPVRAKYWEGTVLLGWGSLFDRDLPFKAFFNYARFHQIDWDFMTEEGAERVFPTLTPSKAIYGPIEWLQDEDGRFIYARENRTSQQPGFYDRIERALTRARQVREAM